MLRGRETTSGFEFSDEFTRYCGCWKDLMLCVSSWNWKGIFLIKKSHPRIYLSSLFSNSRHPNQIKELSIFIQYRETWNLSIKLSQRQVSWNFNTYETLMFADNLSSGSFNKLYIFPETNFTC
jgi:hypothetical protein